MGRIKKLVAQIPFWDAMLSFGARLGIGTVLWITLAMVGGFAMTVWAWLYSNVPPWGLGLIFLFAAAMIAIVLAKVMAMWRDFTAARTMNKFDVSQISQFGQDLIDLSEEIFKISNNREREHFSLVQARAPVETRGEDYKYWAIDQRFRQATGGLINEALGSKIAGYASMLHSMGFEMPPHFLHNLTHNPEGTARFFGGMGVILKRGNLEEALTLSRDRKFMWTLAS
jgi:hypothetical protein